MSLTLYGIPNCDTVKKARKWLDQNGVAYRFHDFKKAGLDAATVQAWLQQLDWQILVNRNGTTWRALSDERKATILDAASASALMLESTSVIKRPVLVVDQQAHVGFSEQMYQKLFEGNA